MVHVGVSTEGLLSCHFCWNLYGPWDRLWFSWCILWPGMLSMSNKPPCIWIFWIVRDSAAVVWEDMMLVESLSSVHTQALHLVCNGNTDWKRVWFLDFLSTTFHFQFCCTNITNNLENGRKMVIWIVSYQYMNGMFLSFCCHQPQSSV